MRIHPFRGLAPMLLVCLCLSACGRSPAAPVSNDVLGTWEKPGGQLPPITLTISQEGTALHARLNLSGRELNGAVTLSARTLTFRFLADPGMTAELLSGSQMRFSFPQNDGTYTLNKLAK